MKKYLPEGFLINTEEMQAKLSSQKALYEAYINREYIETRAIMCDAEHNLHFRLGSINGFMPREECAEGVREGTVRDIAIISRVNKPVGFYIEEIKTDITGEKTAILSRAARQKECRENYISLLSPGDIITVRVSHIEPFGVFCDVAAGITALLPIDGISVSRIPDPGARFNVGEDIKAVVKDIDEDGRITLTHKELLGTWEENASQFKAGQTVTGIIRSVEPYGVFVELTPNLAGLAEYVSYAVPSQSASVFIKSINPEKMKIKLIIVDTDEAPIVNTGEQYFIESGHIDFWQYSPDCAEKKIYTRFSVK